MDQVDNRSGSDRGQGADSEPGPFQSALRTLLQLARTADLVAELERRDGFLKGPSPSETEALKRRKESERSGVRPDPTVRGLAALDYGAVNEQRPASSYYRGVVKAARHSVLAVVDHDPTRDGVLARRHISLTLALTDLLLELDGVVRG